MQPTRSRLVDGVGARLVLVFGVLAAMASFGAGGVLAPRAAFAQDELAQPGAFTVSANVARVEVPGATAFDALLYYPAPAAAPGAALEPSGAPYPVVVFGHGFLQAPSRYSGVLAHMASWGFIVIAPDTQTGFSPSHGQFALDMRTCIDWLVQENGREGSVLRAGVDVGAIGIGGHSMGGGAATLAAADDPRIIAIATLAAAETNPSAVAAAGRLSIPASYISGSQDSITPLAQHGQRMYDAQTSPRQLPLILGGSHCGFQDDPFPLFCDSGSLPRAEQLALTRRLLTGFFLLHLKDDRDAEVGLWPQVWGPAADADERLTTTKDPRTTLEAPERVVLPRGTRVAFEISVGNTGPARPGLQAFAQGPRWPSAFDPEALPSPEPGQAAPVSVTIDAPLGEQGTLPFLLSVRREDGTRAYAWVEVEVQCTVDCDGNGTVDLFDFLCFLDRFSRGDMSADCDGDGALTVFDFLCYQSGFSWGCP